MPAPETKPAETKRYWKGPMKFWTKISRYVDGHYVHADVEHPALITLPSHCKIEVDEKGQPVERTLVPYVEDAPPPAEKPAKPFAEIRRGPPGRIGEERGGRPSDTDPAGR